MQNKIHKSIVYKTLIQKVYQKILKKKKIKNWYN